MKYLKSKSGQVYEVKDSEAKKRLKLFPDSWTESNKTAYAKWLDENKPKTVPVPETGNELKLANNEIENLKAELIKANKDNEKLAKELKESKAKIVELEKLVPKK